MRTNITSFTTTTSDEQYFLNEKAVYVLYKDGVTKSKIPFIFILLQPLNRNILAYINQYIRQLDFSELKNLLIKQGKRQEYKRNEYFVHQDEMCRNVGVIESGAFRYSCTDRTGNDHIVSYGFEDDLLGCFSVTKLQKPSLINIQATTSSVIYILPHQTIEDFFNSDAEKQLLGRQAVEANLLDIGQQILSIYRNTPEERYLQLTSQCQNIQNMVTLREIASYLMITPETLSRIRRKIIEAKP